MPNSAGRIKVGVDFGTTYTGVASVHTDCPSDLATIKVWPGPHGGSSDKVPSVFAYNSTTDSFSNLEERSVAGLTTQWPLLFDMTQQSGLVPVSWGQQVADEARAIRFSKILLDGSQHLPHFVDPQAILLSLQSAGRTVEDGVADFLAQLREHTYNQLVARWGAALVTKTPIDYIFTVPAVWSDAAKEATRNAAVRAGMGSNLRMISEPEAAAVHTLTALQPNKRIVGQNILVGDCGGGTIDLITYKLTQIQPTLKVKEIVAGTGGLHGSVFIDQRFEQFIRNKMGEKRFLQMLHTKPRAWATAKQNFESFHKRNFSTQDSLETYMVQFPGLPDDAEIGLEDCFMTVTPEEMKTLFDPVIDKVVELFDDQVVKLHARGENLAAIILVGGFGQSPYLYERLRAHFTTTHPPTYARGRPQPDNYEIEIMRPPYAWQAVVLGAAQRGLEDPIVATRVYRQHLGMSCTVPWREGYHQRWQKYYDNVQETYEARGVMAWIIPKGAVVSEQQKFSEAFCESHDNIVSATSTVTLYASETHTAPALQDLRPGRDVMRKHCTLLTDLSRIPQSKWKLRRAPSGKQYYTIFYLIRITIDSASMDCELVVDDVSYGSVTKSFDD